MFATYVYRPVYTLQYFISRPYFSNSPHILSILIASRLDFKVSFRFSGSVHTPINYLLTKYHAVSSSDRLVSFIKPEVKTIFRSAQNYLRVFRESAIVLNFRMLN